MEKSKKKIYAVQLFIGDCDFSRTWVHFVSESKKVCEDYCKRLNDLNEKVCKHEADQSFKFKETYDYSRFDFWCQLTYAVVVEINIR